MVRDKVIRWPPAQVSVDERADAVGASISRTVHRASPNPSPQRSTDVTRPGHYIARVHKLTLFANLRWIFSAPITLTVSSTKAEWHYTATRPTVAVSLFCCETISPYPASRGALLRRVRPPWNVRERFNAWETLRLTKIETLFVCVTEKSAHRSIPAETFVRFHTRACRVRRLPLHLRWTCKVIRQILMCQSNYWRGCHSCHLRRRLKNDFPKKVQALT